MLRAFLIRKCERMWRGGTVVASLVATIRLRVEMEPRTCWIRRCADWYIYLPIILRIVQLLYQASVEVKGILKNSCKDGQTIMGMGSEPGTLRVLVQVVISAPRHSYTILPHKARSCFWMMDALLPLTCIHQVLKSQDKVRTNVTLRRSSNHFCCGYAISITYSECVIQHAKRMRRIILLSVAFLAVPYFYHVIS